MTAVLAKMQGTTVRAGVFRFNGRPERVGITRAACLPQLDHVIAIDTKQNWNHKQLSNLANCRPDNLSLFQRLFKAI